MKNLEFNQVKSLVIAAILLVVGVLFCCSLAMGISGLSVVLGIILMVAGLIFIINAFTKDKTILSTNGIIGSLITALGILAIASKIAGILFGYIPWLLIVFGALIIIDSLIVKYYHNNAGLTDLVVKMVLGIVAIVLGICLNVVDGFMEYASIILGILMIISAVYIIINTFILKKSAPATKTE